MCRKKFIYNFLTLSWIEDDLIDSLFSSNLPNRSKSNRWIIARRSSIKENRTDAYLFFNQRVSWTDPKFNPINVIDSIHPGLFSTSELC